MAAVKDQLGDAWEDSTRPKVAKDIWTARPRRLFVFPGKAKDILPAELVAPDRVGLVGRYPLILRK